MIIVSRDYGPSRSSRAKAIMSKTCVELALREVWCIKYNHTNEVLQGERKVDGDGMQDLSSLRRSLLVQPLSSLSKL